MPRPIRPNGKSICTPSVSSTSAFCIRTGRAVSGFATRPGGGGYDRRGGRDAERAGIVSLRSHRYQPSGPARFPPSAKTLTAWCRIARANPASSSERYGRSFNALSSCTISAVTSRPLSNSSINSSACVPFSACPAMAWSSKRWVMAAPAQSQPSGQLVRIVSKCQPFCRVLAPLSRSE